MSQGIESHIDWTASKTRSERVGPGLSGRPDRQDLVPPGKQAVMDTLLGKHNLTASDLSGSDPYNATGRHFRR